MRAPTLDWRPGLLLVLLVCAGVLTAEARNVRNNAIGIWDDNGTEGQSGVKMDMGDEGSSEGKSGFEASINYWRPPNPLFEDVDDSEISDNTKKHYSPYAMVQFLQPFSSQGVTLSNGYYLVKLARANGGSPNSRQRLNEQSPTVDPTRGIPAEPLPPFDVFLVKAVGVVKVAIPIEHREPYVWPRSQRKPKGPVGWTELDERQDPVLKVYNRGVLYQATLQRRPEPE